MRVVGMWMVVALFAPIAAADLIGAQGGLTGNLVAISPVDGSTTVLGPHGTLLFYAGLDVRRSDGQMFGLSAGSEPIARPAGLYRIDPWTATSTLVGTIQSPSNDFLFEGGFAISPDGVGYGLYYTTTFAPGNPFSLIRIDLDTAAFSVVGAVTPVGINGLVFRSDGKLIG